MDITSYLLGKNSAGGGGGGGSDLDWTALGYTKRPQAIDDAYNYAKQIKDNWVPATNLYGKFQGDYSLIFFPFVDTSTAINTNNMFTYCSALISVPLINTASVRAMGGMFSDCYSLKSIPLFDTQNVTQMNNMFNNCYSLKDVPKFKTDKVTTFNNMFSRCNNLTNDSLNNILEMCIGATSYTGTKTLYQLGINDATTYPAARIQALSNYQAFIDAGWTIGY